MHICVNRFTYLDSELRHTLGFPGFVPPGSTADSMSQATPSELDLAFCLPALARDTMTAFFGGRAGDADVHTTRLLLRGKALANDIAEARRADAEAGAHVGGSKFAHINAVWGSLYERLCDSGVTPLGAALLLLEGDHVAKSWLTRMDI